MIYALLSGEDYTNAEAFLLTISLNNYPREHPKFKVVQEWESRFLDIVQEYQKNPSTNFTFAYMAEVSLETLVLNRYILLKWGDNPLSLSAVFHFALIPNSELQRSLEDEINRTTIEDIPIFMISYAVIFLYIAVALGEYSSFKRILVSQRVLIRSCS